PRLLPHLPAPPAPPHQPPRHVRLAILATDRVPQIHAGSLRHSVSQTRSPRRKGVGRHYTPIPQGPVTAPTTCPRRPDENRRWRRPTAEVGLTGGRAGRSAGSAL